MSKKAIPIAIIYDFDGTLSPSNMQEYNFLPRINSKPKEFWNEVNQICKEHQADNILVYMMLMLKKADQANIPVRRKDFQEYGKSVELFNGVEAWFERVNEYGKTLGAEVKHYIISSGNKEIIEGTKIRKVFKEIFASAYKYDASGKAEYPAVAINYTTKTQFLFRINKGVKDFHDNNKINEFIPEQERVIPFTNMIFIGDGETDIPCFRLVKQKGGHSLAVYNPKIKGKKGKAEKLIKDGRVDCAVASDYSDEKELDSIVKAIIDKIVATSKVQLLTGGKVRRKTSHKLKTANDAESSIEEHEADNQAS